MAVAWLGFGAESRFGFDVQAEEDELERSQRWIKDDDHLQEEEDKVVC